MSQATVQLEGEICRFSGELNLDSVPEALNKFETLMAQVGESVLIDLQGVTRIDSGGVAFLVECLRLLQLQNKSVKFSHLPEQMLEMAKLSGLQNLLKV
ncbi:MAG: STAS domain-containing protein [Gammaproteobacteria bacterium]|nr:STAS domain-containing protein [Gammaproteobacteria bacterium]